MIRLGQSRLWQAICRPAYVCAGLAVVTFAAYWPLQQNGFVANYDDRGYIVDNIHVISGVSVENAWWACTTLHAANWHPLTWVSHQIDCQVFGLQPGGHHLVNLVLHTANALLLCWLVLVAGGSLTQAAFVAALFALHPVHVESVAWASERKDVLSVFWGLLAIIAYVKYSRRLDWRLYFGALGFFALSLLSKPMLVTLPFLLLLLDWWPCARLSVGRIRTRALVRVVLEKLPFAVLSALVCVVTMVAQSRGSAVSSLDAVPMASRLANMVLAYVGYIEKLLWPRDLSILYLPDLGTPGVALAGAAAVLLVISAASVVLARRHGWFFVGWWWFVGTLVPAIGIVQVGKQSMADRYTYFPSIGLAIALAWGGAALVARWPRARFALAGAVATGLAVLAILTWKQVHYWHDGATLFRHAVEATRNNYVAYDNLGLGLLDAGKPDEAIAEFRHSISIRPDNPNPYDNIGRAFLAKGQPDSAMHYAARALELNPRFHYAILTIGSAQAARNDFPAAIASFEKAIAIDGSSWEVINNLGMFCAQAGRPMDAVSWFSHARALAPQVPGVALNLARASLETGDTAAASETLVWLMRRHPRDVDVRRSATDLCREFGIAPDAVLTKGDSPGPHRR